MGAGVIDSTSSSERSEHPSVLLRVSVTVPTAISAEEGTYTAFNVLGDGEKLPVPDVVHIPADPPAVTDPARVALLPSQTIRSLPALTAGSGVIIIVVCDVRTVQPSVLVSVSVAFPVLIAEASGVNTALSVLALGENVPGPDQIPALPPTVTDPLKLALPFAQIV